MPLSGLRNTVLDGLETETIDDETTDAAVDYLRRQAKTGRPFFCWMNTTRMHFRTHVKAEHRDKPGLTARTEYADGMIEHDDHVGKLLKAVDDLYTFIAGYIV